MSMISKINRYLKHSRTVKNFKEGHHNNLYQWKNGLWEKWEQSPTTLKSYSPPCWQKCLGLPSRKMCQKALDLNNCSLYLWWIVKFMGREGRRTPPSWLQPWTSSLLTPQDSTVNLYTCSSSMLQILSNK